MNLGMLDLEAAARGSRFALDGRRTCFYNAIEGDHVPIITEPLA